jgi:CheY-like chemotaxis protein/DNA-directed RNA polymerase specialized sigma24 family protein
MLNSTTLAQHLPHLRRFARALTGSQKSGDAYVAATLEAIAVDDAELADLSPRVALYKSFLTLLNSVHLNSHPTIAEQAAPAILAAERRLAAMTPPARQAFLLLAVEAFCVDEVATILDATPDEVKILIDRAGREIAREMASDVLIVEDEPLIALDLERIVRELGHRVSRVARTHKQAVAAVKKDLPGLVLADIELADGSSGIDAVKEIVTTFEVPVIFVTAYPERLLTGKRPEPTFLITKPFRPEALKAVISQALFFEMKARPRCPVQESA